MTLRKGDADGTPGMVVQTSASSNTKDNISALYGSHIARELIEIEQEDEKLQIKVSYTENYKIIGQLIGGDLSSRHWSKTKKLSKIR